MGGSIGSDYPERQPHEESWSDLVREHCVPMQTIINTILRIVLAQRAADTMGMAC